VENGYWYRVHFIYAPDPSALETRGTADGRGLDADKHGNGSRPATCSLQGSETGPKDCGFARGKAGNLEDRCPRPGDEGSQAADTRAKGATWTTRRSEEGRERGVFCWGYRRRGKAHRVVVNSCTGVSGSADQDAICSGGGRNSGMPDKVGQIVKRRLAGKKGVRGTTVGSKTVC